MNKTINNKEVDRKSNVQFLHTANSDSMNKIIQGDCLEKLKDIPDNYIDAIVTDPPYGIGFMGKKWDSTGIAYNVELWKECLRILKPGGHILAFGGTRTYHRMASAIEDAGFEVRDMIEWVYSTGFPKSLNIGKAIDKKLGAERNRIKFAQSNTWREKEGRMDRQATIPDNNPVTPEAKQWNGWGTALKPAHEPICMARKPLAEKTVAENVLKYGTGGINIDESRVEYTNNKDKEYNTGGLDRFPKTFSKTSVQMMASKEYKPNLNSTSMGRFPANLIHDNSEEVRECFPESKSAGKYKEDKLNTFKPDKAMFALGYQTNAYAGDSGNASRFFKSIIYQAKASKSERNKGCEGLEEKEEVYPGINTFDESGNRLRADGSVIPPLKSKNNHPTIKPIALMEYLIKMVTPKGGTVLDPFAGSGSTLIACKNLNRNYIGIEIDPEYIKIIKARLNEL
jgi:site-specific DNA-methyltransferase (adenine-specific)